MAHAIGWTVVSAPALVHSARAVVRASDDGTAGRMQLAASGAFMLLLTSLKLPSVAGSSSHPTGTGLGTALRGPQVMPVLAALVLLFQALLLAHGGLTTLGANVFALGIVGPWVAYGVFRGLCTVGVAASIAVGVASACADLATYVVTALQLGLAFATSGSDVAPTTAKFLTVFAVTQLPLAVLEGVFAALVWRTLQRRRRPVRAGATS